MKRQMTVTYATDANFLYSPDKQKPMIRLANFFLLKSGFKVGDNIEVEYQDSLLIIKKIIKIKAMKTNYKNRIASPYQMTREKTFSMRNKSPIQEEIDKNTGTFNLAVEVKKDKETIDSFKHIPNLISFITTLKNENGEVVGIGRGSAVVNRLNKFIERTVRFAYNSSLIDAIVRSTKILDALYITPVSQENIEVPNEADLEGRDKPAFFGEEDMPKVATEKQRAFLNRLIDEKCDDDTTKEEYLGQLNSPYLSKFDCSQLINSLLSE